MNSIKKTKKKITILLTSAGGLTGVFLSKHFNQNCDYKIIAIDMSNLNPLNKWVDSFYKVPSVKDESFIPKLKEIIDREKVEILLPLSSYDIDFFSKLDILSEIGPVKMLVMDYSLHNKLHDKKICYEYLKNNGIRTPDIYYKKSELIYPCVIKPRKSSGSKNTVVLYDDNDFEYWSRKIDDSIIVEYLDGKEYTVDCLFDNHGKCLGASVRERLKTAGGGATISRINNKIKIDELIIKIEKLGKLKGPINFQFKILSNGEICVFDFNTRFASGGLSLTVKSGFDIPNMLVNTILGSKVKKWENKESNNGLTVVKYYDEYFLYDK